MINSLLLAEAQRVVGMTKEAIVPMPGGQPPDPTMMGGAPPMDPMAMAMPMAPPAAPGAAPGAAPAAPGAAPAPAAPAAGASKKLDPQIIYTILWQLLKLNVAIANNQGVTIPPDVLLGMPPDPMAQQATQQMVQGMDAAATAGTAGLPPPADPAAGGAMPPGGEPKTASMFQLGTAIADTPVADVPVQYDEAAQNIQSMVSNAAALARIARGGN